MESIQLNNYSLKISKFVWFFLITHFLPEVDVFMFEHKNIIINTSNQKVIKSIIVKQSSKDNDKIFL